MSIAFLTRAYNAEPFLEQCVQSVLGQRNAELLYFLCNNGSTDGTAALIRSFAARDGRVRPLFLPENEPIASMNRLLSLAYASGCRYLAVVDADDWIEPDFAQKTETLLERTGGDLCLCGTSFFGPRGELGLRALSAPIDLERGRFGAWIPQLHVFLRTYWGKLWRISALARPSPLLVDASLFYGSDTIFALEGFCRCRRVVGEPGVLYHYRMHGASDSHRPLPDRFSDDLRQHSRTASLLAGNGWLTPENRLFLERVFLNACADTLLLALHVSDFSALVTRLHEVLASRELLRAWRAVCAANRAAGRTGLPPPGRIPTSPACARPRRAPTWRCAPRLCRRRPPAPRRTHSVCWPPAPCAAPPSIWATGCAAPNRLCSRLCTRAAPAARRRRAARPPPSRTPRPAERTKEEPYDNREDSGIFHHHALHAALPRMPVRRALSAKPARHAETGPAAPFRAGFPAL